MKLLVLCPHYAPDTAPTGEVMTQIADGLLARGHDLHLVTSLPWYAHHRIEDRWRGRLVRHEDRGDMRITRVHPFPTSDKSNIPARALGFVGFSGLATVQALLDRSRPDAVLAMSPPLFLGAGGWLAGKRHRAPLVFNIQDVFPDAAVESGALRNRQAIAAMSWLERESYLAADAITVLSEDLRENVVAKITGRRGHRGDPSKVRVIPNFIDTGRIQPLPRDNSYREEHGLLGRTVVTYAGNIGFSQPLDLVLEAARRFRDDHDVVFVINGGGSALPDLKRRAEGLDNVRFVDMQPKDRLPEVVAAGDIHLVLLKPGLSRSSVPSKLYTILAGGRPVLASVDADSEVPRTLDRAGAGLSVSPDDTDGFMKALQRLVENVDERRRMGEAARRFVESWPSPADVAESYEALFRELIDARRTPTKSGPR